MVEGIRGETLMVSEKASAYNLFGLCAKKVWKVTNAGVPFMSELPGHREVQIPKDPLIEGLNRSNIQSQKATYVALISKELYYEFKVVFEGIMKQLQRAHEGFRVSEPEEPHEASNATGEPDDFIMKDEEKQEKEKFEVLIGYK